MASQALAEQEEGTSADSRGSAGRQKRKTLADQYTHIHKTHTLFLVITHHVLIGHDELLNSLLPHPEHLGALVCEQGELLQHHVLGRLDLGAQIELRGLGV